MAQWAKCTLSKPEELGLTDYPAPVGALACTYSPVIGKWNGGPAG